MKRDGAGTESIGDVSPEHLGVGVQREDVSVQLGDGFVQIEDVSLEYGGVSVQAGNLGDEGRDVSVQAGVVNLPDVFLELPGGTLDEAGGSPW